MRETPEGYQMKKYIFGPSGNAPLLSSFMVPGYVNASYAELYELFWSGDETFLEAMFTSPATRKFEQYLRVMFDVNTGYGE